MSTNVMHVVDSLQIGGAERLAVNLVNHLPRELYRPFLCSTRADGPLRSELSPDVGYLNLGRKHRFDLAAVKRLIDFNRQNQIRILHAHGSALFIARLASQFSPRPAVIWHAHRGHLATQRGISLPWRLACKDLRVIAVSQPLLQWCRDVLRLPSTRTHYLSNFITIQQGCGNLVDLPGTAGSRIICVGNIRPEKDHATLVAAFALVVQRIPECHLLLVGAPSNTKYAQAVSELAVRLGIAHRISFLGQRQDVPVLLRRSDIGVISSRNEGLPMALLEYGGAGLASIATTVGECAEVLDHGRAGVLVPPGTADDLAAAMISLLQSPERRAAMAIALRNRVQERYSADSVVTRLCDIYRAELQLHARRFKNNTVLCEGSL